MPLIYPAVVLRDETSPGTRYLGTWHIFFTRIPLAAVSRVPQQRGTIVANNNYKYEYIPSGIIIYQAYVHARVSPAVVSNSRR